MMILTGPSPSVSVSPAPRNPGVVVILDSLSLLPNILLRRPPERLNELNLEDAIAELSARSVSVSVSVSVSLSCSTETGSGGGNSE
jgi:hypothetical protein